MNVTYRPYTFLSFFLVSNDFVLIKKRSIVMIYIFIFLLFSLILLAGVTAFFFASLKYQEVPANVRLVIDTWNSVRNEDDKHDERTEDRKKGGFND
ncbi:MAG: hypothetical protein D3905_15745 [Candidatus Electrothrix sp. AS4_5]|nr:hypothetical protein [Candidatus Electrothrix gigas]